MSLGATLRKHTGIGGVRDRWSRLNSLGLFFTPPTSATSHAYLVSVGRDSVITANKENTIELPGRDGGCSGQHDGVPLLYCVWEVS